jgi:two-component system, chemotaxis family, CheB/CheR fusion protein
MAAKKRARRGRDELAIARPQSLEGGGEQQPFPVVGIGASAGGLEAFLKLIKQLPTGTGIAFVLVQHLSPQHESALPGLLSRGAAIPVNEVRDGMRVAPDHIYVIPPNVNMALQDGILQLSRRVQGSLQTPIDFFFRSLAESRKSGAAGVILSGTGSDGTEGLKAIKSKGGITFAQDESSAKFAEMPRHAVEAGCVDFVMKPEAIARELAAFGQHPYLAQDRIAAETEPAPEALDTLRRIFQVVQRFTGVDFSLYRETTVNRRIQRRMLVHKARNLGDYLKYLSSNTEEAAALCQDILIPVTEFFRDPKTFAALKRKVFPRILKRLGAGHSVRIWVAGCATGEEAYSLAICVLEYLAERSGKARFQIFATDVSDGAIQKARSAFYPDSIEANVSPQRLRRFFVKSEYGYQVSRTIRDLCIFAKHDLTRDPPFSNMDLILCRNVLIYLKPSAQKRIIPVFHYALRPDGFLMLGSAESAGAAPELFSALNRGTRIYVRKPTAPRLPLSFAGSPLSGVKTEAAGPLNREAHGGPELQGEAGRILFDRYAPGAVIIDSDFQVQHFLGRTGTYLEPAQGEASLNLLRIVREGLAFDLRAMVQQARDEGKTVRREERQIKFNGGTKWVNLEVLPLGRSSTGSRYLMVIFEPAQNPDGRMERAPGKRLSKKLERRPEVRLRQELETTQKYLQSVIQEQEASNEELRAANEEILSSNEELQSTNEELETAKEELQSANEELTTLNEELQNRNAELGTVNSDLMNLLSSVNIPVLILDNDLHIRRFTPAAERLFNIIPTDVGRRITDLRYSLNVTDLDEVIADVIERVTPREMEVRDTDNHWYSLRIRPYKTMDNRIAGAVLVLLDIHLHKTNLRYQEELLDLVPFSVTVIDLARRVIFWNRASEALYGYTRDEAMGSVLFELLKTVYPGSREKVVEQLTAKGRWQGELAQTAKDGRQLNVSSSWTLLRDDAGRPSATVEINQDITKNKRRDALLAEIQKRYQRYFSRDLAGNFRASPEGKILECNQAFMRLCGVESRDQVVGASFRDLCLNPAKWDEWVSSLKQAEEIREHEVELIRKDGTTGRALMNIGLMTDGETPVVEGTILDVTGSRQAETSLRELARRLVLIQDEERQRFGSQLHDVVGSALVALNMNLDAARNTATDNTAKSTLREALVLGKDVLQQVRTLSYLLHPPLMHDLGSDVALRLYVDGFGERAGIKVQVEMPSDLQNLPVELETALFRILQESLSNIHRHSDSKTANVRLARSADAVTLEVSDRGKGVRLAPGGDVSAHPGLGLITMKERAESIGGRLEVKSAPGKGTTIRAVLPLRRELP